MNNHPVFDSARELLSQGDTGKALKMLIAHLVKDGSQSDYLRSLRLIEANFNAVRQQEIKGILDFSEAKREYARANDALLTIIEALVSGQTPSVGLSGTGDGRRRQSGLVWLLGGGVLLLIGIVVGMWAWQSEKPAPQPKTSQVQCPKFQPEGFKIMVLEFQKLGGEDSKPELGIQTRIRDLTQKNQMITDVRILPAISFDNSTPDLREATELGAVCAADMVIWGQYEKSENALVVDIRYSFTDPAWPPGKSMQTFSNVSALKSDQMRIDNLDEAVFRLCTALALHQNRIDLAEKWLNRLESPNEREKQWKKVLKSMPK